MTYRLRTLCAFTLLTAALAAFFSPAFGATTQLPITLHSGSGTGAALRCVGAPSTAPACGYATRDACDGAAAQRKLASYVCKGWGKWAPDAPPPPPPAVTWTQCAREGQRCEFTGRREVRYTAAGGASVRQITKVAEGGVMCVDGPFGAGFAAYENLCSYSGATTTAPVTVLPDAPPPPPPPVEPPPPATNDAGPRVTTFTASGPITATAGQVISGVRISNAGAPCITIPAGATGVVVRDSDIGPCGGSANIFIEGAGALVEHVFVHHGNRGVMAHRTSGTVTRASRFDTFYGPKYNGTAIEYDYMASGDIDGNVVTGSNYASDAISVFDSSNIRLTNNAIDIQVDEPSAAAFTMGDSVSGKPGANNYVAGNTVRQRGGAPAGVFGSSGNTVLERNCLAAGIQAYNYSGVFVGVTVRQNVINMAASFVPDSSVIAEWSTNIDSTDCSRVPK